MMNMGLVWEHSYFMRIVCVCGRYIFGVVVMCFIWCLYCITPLTWVMGPWAKVAMGPWGHGAGLTGSLGKGDGVGLIARIHRPPTFSNALYPKPRARRIYDQTICFICVRSLL